MPGARRFAAGLALLLLVTALPTSIPVEAAEPEPPGKCTETMPLTEVEAGQTGVGWTVVRGTDPRPFAVEVLGVYPNGILPSLDVILVRVSDLDDRHFIEDARGIWAGMSGSPVYIGDRLVGAVAYGYSAGPSTLGGLTPIGQMLAVGDLEDTATGNLSRRLRRALRSAGPAGAAAGAFGRLALPTTLPQAPTRAPRGATRKRRAAMRARFDLGARLARQGLAAQPVFGTARSAGARTGLASSELVPGGNFAASLSFGDLDVVATGTTTWVCGERVVAFGHPLLATGRTNLGAHLADSLDIVDDPTFTPYKLAVPGALVGRVGQDRMAAVAGRLDRLPELLTVTSDTRKSSQNRSRQGSTKVPARTPRFLQWELPSYHAEANVLAVAGAFEEGSVGMTLRVRGRRADGSPFGVTFGDRWIGADERFSDTFDTASAALYGVGTFLGWLVENPFERITLDEVDMDLDLGTAAIWQLVGLSVSRNRRPPTSASPVCVAPGDLLTVRALLETVPGGRLVERRLTIDVPRRFERLRISAGAGFSPWFDPSFNGSFEGILQALRRRARSDELVLRIKADGITRAQTSRRFKRVVSGVASIALEPIGSPRCS